MRVTHNLPGMLALLAALFLCAPSLAQETNRASGDGFSAFRIISDRNIFNPNRSSRVERPRSAEPERKPVAESFALVGTMTYDKGDYAFFDSSNLEYRKALKPSDKIAGYTITEIGASHVKLETNGQPVELRVGMQMTRHEQGEWQISAATRSGRSGSTQRGSSAARPAESKAAGGTTATPPADESDILKRLMQKRQEEMNQ